MTAQEAREEFNKALAHVTDPDSVARLELAREYFTNPTFRQALSDYVWAINQKGAK